MKPIAWPSPARNSAPARALLRPALRLIVALSAMAAAATALASTRPRTGGTLRVQMIEHVENIDPRQWPASSTQAAALERLDALVFDRLIRLDERGALQPALAVSWQYDSKEKCWQFRMRAGVKFSDGTPLTPPIAAMALQQLLGVSFDVSADSDSVLIRAEQLPMDLPMQLATGRYFIFHAGDDGSLTGTGPFRRTLLESAGAATMMSFDGNSTCWAGRPFVDKLVIRVGVTGEQQADAIAFGQADLVELPPSQVRRSAQRGVRTVSSEPVELIALVVEGTRPAIQDSRVRQAVSLAIDRSSIANVILQGQGTVAAGLLPNWISGYAHLFPIALDLPRAKDLLAASGYQLSRSAPLALVYDSGDTEARAIADRVSVNLRELGLAVQVSEQAMNGKAKAPAADLRLVRRRIGSPLATSALSELLKSFGEGAPEMKTLEDAYDAERSPVESYHVIPLVHVSEGYGLGPEVRDWMAPPWGGWDLANVWLGPPPASSGGASGSSAP
jgi:peptide/nickel transport system substrate-binding protein